MADKRKVLWSGSGLLRCATPFAGTINHRKPGSCPVAEFSRVPAYTPVMERPSGQDLRPTGRATPVGAVGGRFYPRSTKSASARNRSAEVFACQPGFAAGLR